MKKLILISIMTFGFLANSFSQNYGWTDISTNIPDTLNYDLWGLSDVYFVSDNEGWISVSSDAIILHTTDGGETFEIQTTQFATEAIYMIDENEGYAGGAQGSVYRTTDSGENWIAIGSIGATLTDIDFATSSKGYASGFSGQIYEITSSGLNGMPSNAGTTNLQSICFPDSTDGWVCGESLILHFDDEIWNADQLYPSGYYSSIYFTNNTLGWAVGDNGLIIHTINGGTNWFTQVNPDTKSLFKVFFLNANHGWSVGIEGALLHTNNGGTTWTVEEGLTSSFLRSVHFTSPTNGYVVGNQKTLLKYTEISGIGDEVENIKFEIYPNPAKDKLQIKCSDFKTESGIIEILSLDGKEILIKEILKGNENIELDLRNLKNGMYLCKISTDKKSSTKKLIIE